MFRNCLNSCLHNGKIRVLYPKDYCQEQLRKFVFRKTAEQTHDVKSYAGCCGLLHLCARSSVAVWIENGEVFFRAPMGAEFMQWLKWPVCFQEVLVLVLHQITCCKSCLDTDCLSTKENVTCCPPVHSARGLVYLFFTPFASCFCAACRADWISLQHWMCWNTITSSLFNFTFADAEIHGFLLLIQITSCIRVLRVVKPYWNGFLLWQLCNLWLSGSIQWWLSFSKCCE